MNNELQSGMMLMTEYDSLNFLVGTPTGFIVIDTCGSVIPFDKSRLKYAFIPKDYEDMWEEVEGSQIMFKEEL